MGEPLRALAVGGVLLSRWALEAGHPRVSLFRQLAADGWTRIPGGGWAEPGRAVDWRLRLRAGQLSMPGLVASHRSAARLWDIEVLTDALEFTDPRRRRRKAAARVHWLPLAPTDTTLRDGLRVTTVTRTLADLLRGASREDALVAVDSALSRRAYGGLRRGPLITGRGALTEALPSPLPGASRAHRRLTLADPASGSPAETMARLRMHDAGLHPTSQAVVLTPAGRRLRPDFLFREEGVAVEVEGYAYHGTREAHRRDLHRFNELGSCPEIRLIIRVTAEEVFHTPTRFVRRVREALATSGMGGLRKSPTGGVGLGL